LLYDLTSTYFESDPPFPEKDKRQFGYSRDKRFDCVQVVIALVVTAEGFPLAYEVLPGNTADKTTLKMFLEKIETLYGKARRIWVMDRGIPTEEVLAPGRKSARQRSPSDYAKRNFAKCAGARAVIFCAATCPKKTRPRPGSFTCN
jgi:hypothetical protein